MLVSPLENLKTARANGWAGAGKGVTMRWVLNFRMSRDGLGHGVVS